MLYDSHTGHRIKSPDSRISWVHTQPGFRNLNIRQCLFGLHLLGPQTETVAIVEAEKTAVVASMFFPDVLFLATGGITNLLKETCEPLKDRRAILFPDPGAEEIWREKFRTLSGDLSELRAASAALSNRLISQKWVGFSSNTVWEYGKISLFDIEIDGDRLIFTIFGKIMQRACNSFSTT